jgi:hypothetical protein
MSLPSFLSRSKPGMSPLPPTNALPSPQTTVVRPQLPATSPYIYRRRNHDGQ